MKCELIKENARIYNKMSKIRIFKFKNFLIDMNILCK